MPASASSPASRIARSIGSTGSRWLASTANSTSWCTDSSRASGPSPASATERSPTQAAAMRIRLVVSVPVLSTHSTVAAPSISSAGTRRVSTRRCPIRQAPRLRKIVSTTGSSSGSSAMAVVTPTSRPLSQSSRVDAYTTATSRLSAAPAIATRRTTRAVSRCTRVGSGTRCSSALPMRPSSVRMPVASTRARPLPCTTIVPENSHGRSSPPGAPMRAPDSSATGALRTVTDSPVRRDSSTVTFMPDNSMASAGTRSPSASSIRSPGTTSRPATRTRRPSRITSARGLDRSRNASSARSVRRCCTRVMPITSTTKPSSIAASPGSPSSR